ncbi:protoporphyrinogen oxidase-like [Mya arenaria]|uniref:protoporphyrinogen oxidase-like n=1 Tax=Mya arenaria TaxID=6604 RepID=UPI0022E3ABDB|nr:protoporphyrinogen oxidase-like [Mya arenaria]
MTTAVIIGGGISGLSSAYYLQKSARFSKILLLEASHRIGGWMKTEQMDGGAKFELGPRSLRASGKGSGFNTLCLIEELGLSDQTIHVARSAPAAINRFIYANGKLNMIPNRFLSFFKTIPPFSQPMFLYLLKDMMSKTPTDEADETIYDFITRNMHSDLGTYAVDPMCRGIFAGDSRQLSLQSCLPVLKEAEKLGDGSLFRGIMKKSKEPYVHSKECALFKRTRKERWATFSFKNGLQTLSDTVKDAVVSHPEVELCVNSPCESVSFSNGKAEVTVNGEKIVADHVVSSIYADDLAKLLPQNLEQLQNDLSMIPAVNTVVVVMEFDGEVMPPTVGFGHLLPSLEDKSLLGVIYDSCTFPEHDRTDKPSSRYTVMMGGAWYDHLTEVVPSMTEDALGRYAVSALKKQLNISEDPSMVHVEKLHNSIPQYLVGHEEKLQRISAVIEIEELPLSLVGSSYRGVSVHDCIDNARLEMEKITHMDLM